MSLVDDGAFNLKRDYVYVPAALLIVGTFIVNKAWVIYAVLLSLGLGAWNYWTLRECPLSSPPRRRRRSASRADPRPFPPTEIRPVLKPDVFQEFPLEEKTIISHNVAM